MIGRELDQGILVQIVLEDTQIRAVHHVNLPAAVHVLRRTSRSRLIPCRTRRRTNANSP